jgi:hypothetical protein
MRKQVLIAVLAFAALGASAQTRMEATGPFTYEALGATPTLKIRGTSSAETVRRAQSPATAPAGNDARTKTFTYDAVGATPHVEVGRAQTGKNATMPTAVR